MNIKFVILFLIYISCVFAANGRGGEPPIRRRPQNIPNYAAPQQPLGPPAGVIPVPVPQNLLQPQIIINQAIHQLPRLYTIEKGRYVPILKKGGLTTGRYNGGIFVADVVNGNVYPVHKWLQQGHITSNQNRPAPLPGPHVIPGLNGLVTLTKQNTYKYILVRQDGTVTKNYKGGMYLFENGRYVPIHKNPDVPAQAAPVLGVRRQGRRGGRQPPRQRRRVN